MLFVTLAACGGAGDAPVDQPDATLLQVPLVERFAEVRAIHDAVMPERGRLVRLQRRLAASEELGERVRGDADLRLQRADDMMMDWMYADVPLAELRDSLSAAELATYLDAREVAIRATADSMRAAIAHAEGVLGGK